MKQTIRQEKYSTQTTLYLGVWYRVLQLLQLRTATR